MSCVMLHVSRGVYESEHLWFDFVELKEKPNEMRHCNGAVMRKNAFGKQMDVRITSVVNL